MRAEENSLTALASNRFLRAARLAAVRSNVWPLSAIYEGCYQVAAWVVVWSIRIRFPHHLEAVFLRGSLAMGLLVPALSDIDLFFVLRDEVDPEAHERAQVFYRRLAAWFPVLDPYPWMLRWAEVRKLYDENPSLRFRILEGRQAFQCVYGHNRLAQLPEPGAAETALAHLFDLKTRATYFNAFCLTRTFTDELEARRKEYLLFKLTVELARVALFLSTGVSIFPRREIIRRFLLAEAGNTQFLDLGNNQLLRSFVAYTTRYRLRHSFYSTRGVSAARLEATLLHECLELLVRCYARPDIRGCAELIAEHEHFYGEGRFLPTGHSIEMTSEVSLDAYENLKQQVLAGNEGGVDTVLQYKGLLVNLSNADPRLGNCTAVAVPSEGT